MVCINWAAVSGRSFFQPLAMLRYAIYKKGLAWQDLQIIDAGDVNAIDAAYRHGQGEFVHQQGPYAQQLEFDGLGRVVAGVGEVIGEVAFSSLCADRTWLQTPMARQFMRAYRKGLAFSINTPAAELAKLESEFFPTIHPRVLTQTIATYQKSGTWQADPTISRGAYATTLEVFAHSQVIRQQHAYEKVVCEPPDSAT